MGAQENHVFSLALQFGKGHREITPEIVLYGYTKLLLMDEVQVKALLAEEALDDLETAHKWFSDSGLDLKLIKSGLLLLIPLVPDSQEVRKQYQEFAQFLETAEKEISSKEILSRALETAFLPMAELFGTGKSLDAVFSYQKELKDAKSDEDKAVDSSVQKADSKESVTEQIS